MESLKSKTVKGVGWSAVDNVLQTGVTFLVSIVLARLLSPDDYGLIGLIAIFTAICNTIINAGFTTALIRKKDATDDDYNTVFLVNLTVGLILYAIIYLFSPSISSFFEREELTDLTRVTSLTMVIGALALVQQTKLTKRLDFKSQAKITLFSTSISGIIGIGMAFAGFGVWALVAQQLTRAVIWALMLWLINNWIPNFHFSQSSFHNLFGFGWKIMISWILETIWRELFQAVIGKFYSPAALGQYTRSLHFSQLFSTNLTSVIQRVTYPVLSDIQEDKARMLSAYRRIIKITMFASIICMFSLGAVSEPLLYCLIGPQWHDAAVYLPLICLNGTLYPLHAINLNMLQVQGRSDLFLGLEIIKKIVGVGPLLVGVFVGIMPMLYTNLLAGVIAYFLNSYYSGKILGYSSWMQIKDIASSFWIGLLISCIVYFMKYLPMSYWIVLPLQIIIGVFLFFIICSLSNNSEYKEIREILKPYLKKIKL